MAPLHFLPLITDLKASSDLIAPLSLIGPILLPLDSFPSASSSIPSNGEIHVQASPSSSLDAILSALNEGASKVIVSPSQLSDLTASSIESRRIILELDSSGLGSVSQDVKATVGGVLITTEPLPLDDASSVIETVQTAFPTKSHDLYLLPSSSSSGPPPSQALIKSLVTKSVTLVIPSALLSASSNDSSTQLSIPSAFLAPLTTDRPDSLYATMVTSSTHSSRPLGLVYSSNDSIAESILTGRGVYQSRKHGLWRKGESSGSTQQVVAIRADCDADAVHFDVVQSGTGFCHLETFGCFGSGELRGVAALEETLKSRMADAPEGSYTKRLFGDADLLRAKIMEEAEELCDAESKEDVAFEAADVVYFAMVKCAKMGVSWKDVEGALDKKAQKVKRRKGDAKPKWVAGETNSTNDAASSLPKSTTETPREPEPTPPKASPIPAPPPTSAPVDPSAPIKMRTVPALSSLTPEERQSLLLRPVLDSSAMIAKVQPIITSVRTGGDKALASLTAQFDRQPLASQPEWSNVLFPPFSPESMAIPDDLKHAIDTSYANVLKFHQAQAETNPLVVETQPGVVCSRFARPITRVGLYVPGGTAILPSSAIMLGVPAQVAGCETIVLSTPPRSDGTISPEVLYVANLVGVTAVVKAGGAQAVAAMAYGTETIPKVDKIFGPGNQWVTAAKMVVQNDVSALVGIDMPAGPSEVLVIADSRSNPTFVASDLLSQAEHGVDSQVVLLTIDVTPSQLAAIEEAVDTQARALPRCEIARKAIEKSIIVQVKTREDAMAFSNDYAPEHLIMQVDKAEDLVKDVVNAGSVFVGDYSPESCGDYSSGTNHTLPTYGFARQFSGVNTLSFQKHITSQHLTREGILGLGPIVIRLAECEGLEAHANAVRVRLAALKKEDEEAN